MFRKIFPAILVIVFGASCMSAKKTAYFQNQGKADIVSGNSGPKPVIEINDLLSITVSSLSTQAVTAFNLPNTNTYSTVSYQSSVSPLSGYLVGPDGYIKFPQIDKIKAAGITPAELEERITDILLEKQLLREPIVSVRHLNFKITVLGEVAKPSVFNIPNARVSLLEAIGMAGDLTIYGRRDNVLLIREEGKVKTTVRINLNSSELFTSPYYYLKTNDVVYVEPNATRVTAASKGKEILPIVFSALSLAVIGLDFLLK